MNKAGQENRSVRNTKRKLREGLLQLMAQKPINEISVKELTELVDVNRGTFYFHYADIFDMLHRIEDEFFEQFNTTLNEMVPNFSATGYPYLHAVFGFLWENRSFCKIMLGPNGDMQFVDRVKRLVDEKCSYFWRALAPEGKADRFEMYNAFIINGCIGLIQKWLDDGQSETTDGITELAAKIILASVGPCFAGEETAC